MPNLNISLLGERVRTRSQHVALSALAVLLLCAVASIAGVRNAEAQPSDPAATLIGQRVETCKSGHSFVVEVTGAEIADAAQGRAADGGAAWLLLVISATNTSGESGDLYMALALNDDQGRVSKFSSPGSREEIDLANALGVQTPFSELRPGDTDRLLVTFQVSRDATSFTLVADPIHCS